MGRSWKQFYGGNYMSAKVFGNRKLKAKIEAVDDEDVGQKGKQGRHQVVLTLAGESRKYPLNKTNIEALDKAWGEDFDKWVGKTVEVSTTDRTYEGNAVKGLLIKPVKK